MSFELIRQQKPMSVHHLTEVNNRQADYSWKNWITVTVSHESAKTL